jgi:hypothetical protein
MELLDLYPPMADMGIKMPEVKTQTKQEQESKKERKERRTKPFVTIRVVEIPRKPKEERKKLPNFMSDIEITGRP